MSAITFTSHRDPLRARTTLAAHVDDVYARAIGPVVQSLVLEKIAEAIAAEYVKAHLQDVLAVIDVNAVANLAVADSAAAIRATVDIGVRSIHRDMGELQR